MGTAADFPVKWISSAMPRAPKLYRTVGGALAVLDAFLVTGWGAMTPQRIEIAGGVATVQCNSGDTFHEYAVIEVSGAEPAALNGQHRVLSSTDTSFTFATEAADGHATGTISIKYAPAGWERVFSGENKAVYRSAAPDASGALYRIDNTNADATFQGYAAMSDVDTGDYPFPNQNTLLLNHMENTTETQEKEYFMAADGYGVIVSNKKFSAGGDGMSPFFFGASSPIDGGSMTLKHEVVLGSPGGWISNQEKGLVSQSFGCFSATDNEGGVLSSDVACSFSLLSTGILDANKQSAVVLSRILGIRDGVVFGMAPGIYSTWQGNAMNAVPEQSMMRCHINGKPRVLYSAYYGGWAYPNQQAGVFTVDITGPWR